jgi:hypothetical protein
MRFIHAGTPAGVQWLACSMLVNLTALLYFHHDTAYIQLPWRFTQTVQVH